MIFFSYSHRDQQLVDNIANSIEPFVGKDNITYDHWSIDFGDSIISKMEEGLSKCKIFFCLLV